MRNAGNTCASGGAAAAHDNIDSAAHVANIVRTRSLDEEEARTPLLPSSAISTSNHDLCAQQLCTGTLAVQKVQLLELRLRAAATDCRFRTCTYNPCLPAGAHETRQASAKALYSVRVQVERRARGVPAKVERRAFAMAVARSERPPRSKRRAPCCAHGAARPLGSRGADVGVVPSELVDVPMRTGPRQARSGEAHARRGF